jgi:hypothetical protein
MGKEGFMHACGDSSCQMYKLIGALLLVSDDGGGSVGCVRKGFEMKMGCSNEPSPCLFPLLLLI